MERRSMESLQIEKALLRKEFLKKRTSMSGQSVQEKSRIICRRILQTEWYRQADNILAYMPVRNEVSTLPVLETAFLQGKKLFLPKVCGREMIFCRIRKAEELKKGAFGILEPDGIEAADVTEGLMLVPGTAFDRTGGRLGYGGGFYDRYLAGKTGFVLLGLCYEEQLAARLPLSEYDRRVAAVVTEKQIYITTSERRS